MEVPKHLKTSLYGGIGDTIKILSCLFALPSLHKNFGTKIYVSYNGFGDNIDLDSTAPSLNVKGVSTIPSPWASVLKDNIFKPCPFLIPCSANDLTVLNVPTVQELFDANGPFLKQALTPFLPLPLGRGSPLPGNPAFSKIVVQISSNSPEKMWEVNSWILLVDALLKSVEDCEIYIIDSPDKKPYIDRFFNTHHPRLFNLAGLSLQKSISAISQADLLIAPDSFSKYIALCHGVRSIILCSELPYISPSDMLRSCFLKSITYNNKFSLLGIDYKEDYVVSHCVKNVNEITVEEVLNNV